MLPFALASTLAAQPIQIDGVLCHPHRLIVRSEVARTRLPKGATLMKEFGEIGFSLIEAKNQPVEPLYRNLRQRFGKDAVYLDRAALPAFNPNDPLFGQSWQHGYIQSPQAWDLGLGAPVTVAVIDTGVNYAHPDLAGNMWTNTGEIPGNGIDDDGNSIIDDVYGADFAYGDGDPNDVFGHGTACAGLVASVFNNGIGGCGVAPNAKIMALKASTDPGYFYDSANIGAYLYAVQKGARILSMSFYSDQVSEPERIALEYCVANGILPVVAAGNDRTVIPYYPAAHEVCLSVAALNSNGTKAGFSDFGTTVDVATPGVSLTTTTADGNYTGGFSGTSGACPVAAGIAALILGQNPGLSPNQLRQRLEDSANDSTQSPFGMYTNYGKLNAYQAATNTLPTKAPVIFGLSPLFGQPTPPTGKLARETTVYGRNIDSASQIRYYQNSLPLRIRQQDRTRAIVFPRVGTSSVVAKIGATTLLTVPIPNFNATIFPLLEASARNSSYSGSFLKTLNADGDNATATVDANGNLKVEAVFRNLNTAQATQLRLVRSYDLGSGGDETIRIYDWSTASYPYGSFTTLHTGTVADANAQPTLDIPMSSVAGLPDVDGAVYVTIEITGATEGMRLKLDQMLMLQP